jgi:hypothetical protein
MSSDGTPPSMRLRVPLVSTTLCLERLAWAMDVGVNLLLSRQQAALALTGSFREKLCKIKVEGFGGILHSIEREPY